MLKLSETERKTMHQIILATKQYLKEHGYWKKGIDDRKDILREYWKLLCQISGVNVELKYLDDPEIDGMSRLMTEMGSGTFDHPNNGLFSLNLPL